MDSDIQSIIDRLPILRGTKDIVVEQISGLTNKNYRVTVDGNQYVLRISRENTEKLGINREFELEALMA